jgi:hypothetical protein
VDRLDGQRLWILWLFSLVRHFDLQLRLEVLRDLQ